MAVLVELVGPMELAVLVVLLDLQEVEGVEGLKHLALDLPYLTLIISNLHFNYDSSIIVLFYSSCVTLSPYFYFISCPLFILVTFIYSLSLLSSFPSIYILIPHFMLHIILLQFISFIFTPLSNLYFIFNSQLITDEVINSTNTSLFSISGIPDEPPSYVQQYWSGCASLLELSMGMVSHIFHIYIRCTAIHNAHFQIPQSSHA